MSAVAFLGLGAMGRRMAARVAAAGHRVVAWNRTPGIEVPGVTLAGDPRAAVEGAEVVVCMVTDDEAAREVWLHPDRGALAGMARGAVAIECSTVTPGWIRALGEACDAAEIAFLDAPVAGSTPQAERGLLAFLVGGETLVLDRVRPVLEPMAGTVLHAGPRGRGATLKLVVNALFATQVAVLAELLPMAEAHGLDEQAVASLLGELPVTSPAARGALGSMVARDHTPRFPIRLVAKDLRYALASGAGPVVAAVLGRFEAAARQGLADADLVAV
ncbi:MAG: NAD(P)-dependent oxidoreductase [Alphaproteobacteria bacterium]|nr:NAD(P)-dependent oxidoreductase [Alphaproteobacteria bacterium]MCB9699521.1 NAD(P)-dependent oxidoreductase [Alphaproteobacteria bacterium]